MGDKRFTSKENIYYKNVQQERLKAKVYIPEAGPAPGVILVHGGGWQTRDLDDMESIAQSLASHGYVVFNINYRFSPEFKHPTPINDLGDAHDYFVKHAKEYKLDPKRLALWGYSSGGHTVSYFGLKNKDKVKVVVTGGAPYDFTWYTHSPYISKYLGKFRDEALAEYIAASPSYLVEKDSPTFFIYHAISDKLVEYAQATSFEAKFLEKGVPVKRFDVSFWGHGNAFAFSDEAVKQAILFLKEKLPLTP